MEETDTFKLEFNKLGDSKSFTDLLESGIPGDSLCNVLVGFYQMKLGEYINSNDYESIIRLEGVMDLHNIIKGILK